VVEAPMPSRDSSNIQIDYILKRIEACVCIWIIMIIAPIATRPQLDYYYYLRTLVSFVSLYTSSPSSIGNILLYFKKSILRTG
jgi:hypothetical protein